MANGHTLAMFSCDADDGAHNCTSVIFEADADGAELARAVVPWPADGSGGHPQASKTPCRS